VEQSGVITGIVCHINARSPGGPRYAPEQSVEQRHAFANLLLLCGRHSKLIDSDQGQYTVETLHRMKQRQQEAGPVEVTASDAKVAESLLKNYRRIDLTVRGDVVIKTEKRKINVLPPVESIAASLCHRNYIKHLIDRYQEFASKQPGRQFRHPAIYAAIKRRYGAKWDFVSLGRFDELAHFLHKRIDRTMQGSMNRGKGVPNYSAFDEYRAKYGA
jgi:hypothetical protein